MVGDYRPWRFSFFTPEGEWIRQVELNPPVIRSPDFAIPLAAGTGFVVEETSFQYPDEMADRVAPQLAYGEDGEHTGIVGHFWLERGFLSRETGYIGYPIFGAKASFSHLRGDWILYAAGRDERLEIWSVAGELQGIVRWQARGRDVEPAEADVWRRQSREAFEARTEITPEEYRRPLDEGPARWWVFHPDWRFRCSAALPSDLRVLAVGVNRVFGLARDSLDVEYVLGYDVVYPPARIP